MTDEPTSIIHHDPEALLAEGLVRTMLGEKDVGSHLIEELEADGQKKLIQVADRLPQDGTIKTREAMRIWPLHPDDLNQRWEADEASKVRIQANGGDLSLYSWRDWEHFDPGSDAYDDALAEHLMAKDRAERASAVLRARVEVGTGITFGREIDELFVAATLPAGWTLEATEHPMNSLLKNRQGIVRASVFYKAAPYDLQANVRWFTRYWIRDWAASWPEPEAGEDAWLHAEWLTVLVWDRERDEAVYHGLPFPNPSRHNLSREDYADLYQRLDLAHTAAKDWLETTYPDATRDEFAYWTRP